MTGTTAAGARTLVSFSGGRTSGLMAKMLKDRGGENIFVFANTGEEDERTLRFVNMCDAQFQLNLVWVEAVVDPVHGNGTTHRVVTFETATRGSSIFESMIEKYGIPNSDYPHCTRELKLHPIMSYARSIGWGPGTYKTAIGIRADELDRVNPNFREQNIIYPLCDANIRKRDVFRFWDRQAFDLDLPEHRGNCVWCWKKSLRKHLTLARETPQAFKFAMRMEAEHGHSGSGDAQRVFFRGNRSARDIIELSREPFEAFIDVRYLDQHAGCEESCEIFDPSQMTMDALWKATPAKSGGSS